MRVREKNIDVSVIVPIYNSELYLSRCLDSLVNQSLKSIEFILIDDGSTDNSNNIIKEYMKKDFRFSLIEQKNEGVGSARNKGIKKAEGKYISFIDSDDYIDFQMLENMHLTAFSQDLDIIVSRYRKVDFNDKTIQEGPSYNGFDKETMFKSLLTMSIPSVCWNGLYKRSLFEQPDCLFPNKNMYNEDTATIYKLYYYANLVGFTNSIYYSWYQTPNSKTNSISFKHIDDMYNIVQSFKEFLLQHNIYQVYKYEFIHTYLKAILKKRLQIIEFKKEKKDEYLSYLVKKFTTNILSPTKQEMLIFRKKYPFMYYNTLLLLRQMDQHDNALLDYFTKEDKKLIDSLFLRKKGLEQIIIDYISSQGIRELYIYGVGQFCTTFLKEKDNKIKIIEVIDKQEKVPYQYNPSIVVKPLENISIKKNSNIIVSSLSFAKEITQRIKQYSDKNKLDLRIINFYNCIDSKA